MFKFSNSTIIFSLVVAAIILPWFGQPGYVFLTDFVWGPHLDLNWQSPLFLLFLLIKFVSFILPLAVVQKVFIGLVLFVALLGGRKIMQYFINENNWLVGALSLFFGRALLPWVFG